MKEGITLKPIWLILIIFLILSLPVAGYFLCRSFTCLDYSNLAQDQNTMDVDTVTTGEDRGRMTDESMETTEGVSLEIEKAHGIIKKAYVEDGENKVVFGDQENALTAELGATVYPEEYDEILKVSPNANILLYDCDGSIYTFRDFNYLVTVDRSELLCFGQGGNGYHVTLVNGEVVNIINGYGGGLSSYR